MSWHLYAAAAVLAGSSASSVAQAPPDEVADVDILQMEDERFRRMTVPVTIGGKGPFAFMIDTGAQATVLSHDLADRLELFDRQRTTLVGMASSRAVETTAIPDFELGSRSFYIQSAPVVERAHIGDADGILGLDSLQNQRVLLDFAKKEIAVANAAALGGDKGYEIVVSARRRLGQLIITSARLDGIKVALIVDTGAQSSIGNPALLAKMLRARPLGENSLTDINGAVLSGTVSVGKELHLGQGQLRNLTILFVDSPSFHALGLSDEPALILGMEELRLFKRVAIDFKARRLLFDMPSGAAIMDRHPGGFRH
jgi:predicted aspartyl protease